MNDAVVVVQARTGSTRLPGKVLEPVAGYRLIEHVLLRAQASGLPVVAALPAEDWDGQLAAVCAEHGAMPTEAGPYTGPADDVLGRVAHTVRTLPHNYQAVVRVTGDCPLLDPSQVWAVAQLVVGGVARYASNVKHTRPVDGWDAEAFTTEMLQAAAQRALDPHDREHVTPWMRRRGLRMYVERTDVDVTLQHRWTVDTAEDLAWLRRLWDAGGDVWGGPPRPRADEVFKLLDKNPNLARYT